jgi:hypothetical protein
LHPETFVNACEQWVGNVQVGTPVEEELVGYQEAQQRPLSGKKAAL